VEGGVIVKGRVLLQGLARLGWSFSAPTTGFSVTNPVPTRQRYLKVGGGIAVETIPDCNLSLQVLATPYGQNTISSLDVSLGIDYRFHVFHKSETLDTTE
jgi:hypothetical protein